MSRKNNVNPDHYKTAGRLRQGEAGTPELEKQKYTQARAEANKAAEHLIPGAQPARPSAADQNRTAEADTAAEK